jgi:hypothetical protein
LISDVTGGRKGQNLGPAELHVRGQVIRTLNQTSTQVNTRIHRISVASVALNTVHVVLKVEVHRLHARETATKA